MQNVHRGRQSGECGVGMFDLKCMKGSVRMQGVPTFCEVSKNITSHRGIETIAGRVTGVLEFL
jgi:hypothetical protein